MFRIGFSTGALAKGDMNLGVQMARELEVRVIELSALRLSELETLISAVALNDFGDFDYVSIHAPSSFSDLDERTVVRTLSAVATEQRWPVVVHPDTINDFDLWQAFGPLLYVENMDKRKARGRTVEELQEVLEHLPDAQVCFDIAHAKQIDSSMTEAYRILRNLRHRIRQVHISEVSSDSRHRTASDSAFRAYADVISSIPPDLPVIIESVVSENTAPLVDAVSELHRVREFFSHAFQSNIDAVSAK